MGIRRWWDGPARPVELRRPLLYLLVACALALLATLIPEHDPGFAATDPGQAAGPNPAAAPAPPGPPCTSIQGSLRPTGALPAPGAMPPGSTMAAIVARGRLIVGVDQGDYLSGFRDPATANLEGADIDVARQVAQALFGDPNRIQFVVLSVADRADALRRGQVDLVSDVYTVTCQRQTQVAFSTDYLQISQRLLVPLNSDVHEVEDLHGRPVCTSRGSAPEDVLHRLNVTVHPAAGISECMVELQRGRVAAISTDDTLLAGMAAQDPQTRVVGRSLDTARYALAMNLNAPDLVRFVNGVLERGRADGTLAAIDRHWYGQALNPVPMPPPPTYRD
jgi:polar amino acid transport system substrate-binding protein